MKKILVIALTLLLVTGCGTSKEEKEKMLYESLEKAYVSAYTAESVGLAVYPDQTLEIDGKIWYLVAIDKYGNIENLLSYAEEVYDKDIATKLNNEIKENYKQLDTDLYTLSNSGCDLGYIISSDRNLQEDIKNDIKIKKIKMNKIIFEYKGDEYTAKKDGDHYVFDKQIFTCPTED